MKSNDLALQPARTTRLTIAFLSLAIVLYAAFFSWQSWRQEKNSRIDSLMSIMELSEKSLDTYFFQLEADLTLLGLDWTENGDQIDLERSHFLLKRYKDQHPELTNITVLRPDGQVLFTAKTPPGNSLPTIANEDSYKQFQSEAQSGSNFSIGRPILGAISKVWIVPLRYRVKDRQGKDNFIISANLPVEMLQNFWKDAPITKVAAIGIMRDDGFLLSRFPIPNSVLMSEIYSKPRTGALINLLRSEKYPVSGNIEGPSSLDGPHYLTVFRRLSHYSATIFVTMPVADVWAQWWHKVKIPYILTLLLLAAASVAYFTAHRRQLAELQERARLDRIKSEFISVVSHELRTPVTSIRGALGLLEGGAVGELPPVAMNLVKVAHRNSQRLGTLINDILDMEKLMLGNVVLNIQKIDLVALVAQALEANAGYAETLHVRFVFDSPPARAEVQADPDRLMQVMANLLSNAAKFSPAEGTVYIRIFLNNDHIRVEVQDYGKGIPASFYSRIFSPFSQVNSADTRTQGGTGLGLNISKTLIDKMGGDIGFESKEGHGSTFWFTIPSA